MEIRMRWNPFQWSSLKTRVTLYTLVIFVTGVWSLAFYVSQFLRDEMQRQLGEHQQATVALLADEISSEFTDRFSALEMVARGFTAAMLDSPALAQEYAERNELLLKFFNAGFFVTRSNGDAVAEIPSLNRVGLNYLDRDHIAAALTDGKSVIGKAVIGKRIAAPSFALTVPIRNPQGQVIGAIAGATDLSKPNFLDSFNASRYGKSGGYLIVDARHRLFVTATENNRALVMQPLPALGVNRVLDRRLEGFDGPEVNINSLGREVLTSSARIPAAGWFLIATLPTQEAFAPIAEMQKQMLHLTLAISALMGALVWLLMSWVLRRQFAPMIAATGELDSISVTSALPAALPVRQRDEVGALVGGFNRLLEALRSRERGLIESTARFQSLFDKASDGILILSSNGDFIDLNAAFARMHGYTTQEMRGLTGKEICTPETLAGGAGRRQRIMSEGSLSYEIEGVHKDGHVISLEVSASAVVSGDDTVIQAFYRDITERKRAERALVQSEQFLRESQRAAKIGSYVNQLNSGTFECTAALDEIFGITADYPHTNDGWVGFMHPDFMQPMHDALMASIREKRPFDSEYKIIRPCDGVERWMHGLGTITYDENGDAVSLVGTVQDITERKKTEESQRIAATAFESQQGMFITDAQKKILRVNKAFTTITGYQASEAIGRTPKFLSSGRHEEDFYRVMHSSIAQAGVWQGEIWNRRKNGTTYLQQLSITSVVDDKGQVTNYVAAFSDVTTHRAAEERIQSLSFFDSLTKLPNRRLFMDRLEQALFSSVRHQRLGALAFIDLDDFKLINDTLGHVQGDQLLRDVAQRIRDCVGEGDTVARIGGDEFVVLIDDTGKNAQESITVTEAMCRKILIALGHGYPLGGADYHCTASIGITLFGVRNEAGEEPLKRAELAMYQAKAAGRNTLRFFDPKMQDAVRERAEMDAGLRLALLESQFVLHYQVQVDQSGRTIGVEALIRWNDPRRGMIYPGEFIPLAEETGLILPLGAWVLQTACEQLARWANDPVMSTLTLAVNVSARQFRQPDFVDQVVEWLDRSGARADRLKLELTESVLVSDADVVIASMNALKGRGVSFALDDFGTGYSSLSYLKRLPLDQLKIDKGFVRDILINPNDAAIAKTIIALGNTMGLAVIAEGVETQAQRATLAAMGCQYFQGYLFGRPVPVESLVADLQQS